MRSIQRIIDTEYVKMGPMTIGQPLPVRDLDQISPFLLLHHAGPIPVQAGKNPMHIGRIRIGVLSRSLLFLMVQ